MTPQFITFLTILAAGFVYITVSALLGHIIGDHDGGHGGGHGGHAGHHGQDTISVFSPKVIAIFMVGFGASGAIGTYYGINVILATLSGIGGGIGLGALALGGLRLLYGQQVSSEVYIDSALGLTGIVTLAIPADGMGEVGVTVKGQYLTYFAASTQSIAIPRNTSVKVQQVQGSYLLVGIVA